MKVATVTIAATLAAFCGVAAQPATQCAGTGGEVSTSICCKGVADFPNTCILGACGCSPDSSREVQVCSCPGSDRCFDGTECTDVRSAGLAERCSSYGTVETRLCCKGAANFPNTCIPGPCGCSPEDSEEVKVCSCAARDYCFDGSECTYLIDLEGEASCVESGGKVSIELICRGFEHFPNTCVPGPYSCSDSDKLAIPTCICPGPNPCYDGTKCSSDPIEEYFTLDIIGGGCIGLDQGSARQGNKLKLLECVSDNDAIQWSIDEDIRFHSKVDADMCMQAGHGNSVNDGTKMRIYPCSNSEFQKFDDSFISGGPFGPIKLESEPGLCVVPRGVNRNIGVDPIILKECNGLEEDRAIGWEGDNPCTHPPSCEP